MRDKAGGTAADDHIVLARQLQAAEFGDDDDET